MKMDKPEPGDKPDFASSLVNSYMKKKGKTKKPNPFMKKKGY